MRLIKLCAGLTIDPGVRVVLVHFLHLAVFGEVPLQVQVEEGRVTHGEQAFGGRRENNSGRRVRYDMTTKNHSTQGTPVHTADANPSHLSGREAESVR